MRASTALLTTIATLVVAGNSSAAMAMSGSQPGTKQRISELQKISPVSTLGTPTPTALRSVFAGTLEGKLGGKSIQGALRAVGVTNLEAGTEIVTATEYDARGSRTAKMRVRVTFSNGHVKDAGTGRWTSGTGAYDHARGSFEIRGGGPIGGVSTIRLTGELRS